MYHKKGFSFVSATGMVRMSCGIGGNAKSVYRRQAKTTGGEDLLIWKSGSLSGASGA
jgi:hypothetical protein